MLSENRKVVIKRIFYIRLQRIFAWQGLACRSSNVNSEEHASVTIICCLYWTDPFVNSFEL